MLNNVINIYCDDIEDKVGFITSDETKSIIYKFKTDVTFYIEDSDIELEYNNVDKIKLENDLIRIISDSNSKNNIIRGSYNIEMINYNEMVITTTKEYHSSIEIIGPDKNNNIGIISYYYPECTYKKVLGCEYSNKLELSSVVNTLITESEKVHNVLNKHDQYEYIYINEEIYKLIDVCDYDISVQNINGEIIEYPYKKLANSDCFMFGKNDIIVLNDSILIKDGKVIGTTNDLGSLYEYIYNINESDFYKLIEVNNNYRLFSSVDENYHDPIYEKLILLYSDIIKNLINSFNANRLLVYKNKVLYELDFNNIKLL